VGEAFPPVSRSTRYSGLYPKAQRLGRHLPGVVQAQTDSGHGPVIGALNKVCVVEIVAA